MEIDSTDLPGVNNSRWEWGGSRIADERLSFLPDRRVDDVSSDRSLDE